MRSFQARRLMGGSILLLLAIAVGIMLRVGNVSLYRTAFLSGWLLLALVVFLASYNGRKKLTYPPLGSSAAWLQLHLYGGLLCVVIFLFHTAARWPNGAFETLLALLFWGVAISGVFGIFITRVIPRRLTQAGDEVIYERIPAFRQELREEADRLVLQTVDQSGGTTLAEFHANTLAHYFAGQRSFRSHLTQSSRPLRSLIGQLDDLNRYFNEAEQKAATQLIELIRHKNRLDYHSALQGMLKSWLFVHIPLTYAMLLCAIVHAVIVHAFGGSGL